MTSLTFEKPKTFYFHYNKPASAREGEVRMSVHVDRTCHIIHQVDCRVACKTKINNRQPRVVMQGKCSRVRVVDNTLIIE